MLRLNTAQDSRRVVKRAVAALPTACRRGISIVLTAAAAAAAAFDGRAPIR